MTSSPNADYEGSLDHFYDEAFPDDPYMSGVVRVEIERFWTTSANGSSGTDQ